MSLVRPEQRLEAEPVQEVTFGQRILDDLSALHDEIKDLKHAQEKMTIKLLGEVGEDTKHGRLPMVEATAGDHENRIKSLENDRTAVKSAARTAAWIGGILGGIIGTGATILANIAMAILRGH
ncbi:hypothetical protein GCM10011507_35060 [Edaphobacter acidisoli]|uniref:Uncharacterized protein n=1 Tax=Edaphobacter acidisoli TaxID=2040573 RepID=A0A916S2I7_9BACT|nr:hypothetical protein [Edaphobacter acidisoli]GGA80831.1 hypothetical protein GCM10011507_35060 [Edaphobacter acidisoli]